MQNISQHQFASQLISYQKESQQSHYSSQIDPISQKCNKNIIYSVNDTNTNVKHVNPLCQHCYMNDEIPLIPYQEHYECTNYQNNDYLIEDYSFSPSQNNNFNNEDQEGINTQQQRPIISPQEYHQGHHLPYNFIANYQNTDTYYTQFNIHPNQVNQENYYYSHLQNIFSIQNLEEQYQQQQQQPQKVQQYSDQYMIKESNNQFLCPCGGPQKFSIDNQEEKLFGAATNYLANKDQDDYIEYNNQEQIEQQFVTKNSELLNQDNNQYLQLIDYNQASIQQEININNKEICSNSHRINSYEQHNFLPFIDNNKIDLKEETQSTQLQNSNLREVVVTEQEQLLQKVDLNRESVKSKQDCDLAEQDSNSTGSAESSFKKQSKEYTYINNNVDKKNVVKNIMNSFKNFMLKNDESKIQSQSIKKGFQKHTKPLFSTEEANKKNEQIVSIYNSTKEVEESLEEIQRKFKRYIGSKQFNHYSLSLLTHHQNYGVIFQFFLNNYSKIWLERSQVSNIESHSQIIEFLLDSFHNPEILSFLKKHEKKKSIYS